MLILALAVLASTALVVWSMKAGNVLTRRAHRQVIVTLKAGDTFRGVLSGSDRWSVVLTGAESLTDAGKGLPVDGEVILLLADVKYLQRL